MKKKLNKKFDENVGERSSKIELERKKIKNKKKIKNICKLF